jgi:two-component system chemotaxis response regulator CheB
VAVVGASAGGVEALRALVGALPAELPAAVLIVLHTGPGAESALAGILQRAGELRVTTATDGERLRPGTAYVAQPDFHLLIRDGRIRLGSGPRENGHRPAVDPLFRSAARWYADRVVAVVLSGTLDDGAAGAAAVAAAGGTVMVQDPDEALHSGMPVATLAAVPDATASNVRELAGLLSKRVTAIARRTDGPVPAGSATGIDAPTGSGPGTVLIVKETDIADLDADALLGPDRPGEPSGLACPDCHGVLFEVNEPITRFRCRVGHAWSPESLLVEQVEELESALWMALRVLTERAALHRKIAGSARSSGRPTVAAHSEGRAEDADRSAEVIRQLLLRGGAGQAGQAGGSGKGGGDAAGA